MVVRKETREWLDKVLKEYKVDEDEEKRVNREIGILEEKIEFWDEYIQHLMKGNDIQEALLLCETEKDKLDKELRKAERKRARSRLYSTLVDFIDEVV